MLFAVCAVVYGVLSSYPRELAVYSDELRYLDVARGLLQGRGLRVRDRGRHGAGGEGLVWLW